MLRRWHIQQDRLLIIQRRHALNANHSHGLVKSPTASLDSTMLRRCAQITTSGRGLHIDYYCNSCLHVLCTHSPYRRVSVCHCAVYFFVACLYHVYVLGVHGLSRRLLYVC